MTGNPDGAIETRCETLQAGKYDLGDDVKVLQEHFEETYDRAVEAISEDRGDDAQDHEQTRLA